jgi:hypothetical protein
MPSESSSQAVIASFHIVYTLTFTNTPIIQRYAACELLSASLYEL